MPIWGTLARTLPSGGQCPHMGGAQSDQPLAARPGDHQIVELDVEFAARRRQRPLDIGNEELQMERPPLGKAIGGEAGHDDQPGNQCADDLEPETQAATNQTGYP